VKRALVNPPVGCLLVQVGHFGGKRKMVDFLVEMVAVWIASIDEYCGDFLLNLATFEVKYLPTGVLPNT